MNTALTASHWSLVDPSNWPWQHFSPQELASRGDGSIHSVMEAVDLLEKLREQLNVPLRIHSAYRDPLHNARIGGAPRSRHKIGDAFDVGVNNIDRFALLRAVTDLGFSGIGKYQTFLHIDTRPYKARWYGGERSERIWVES